MKAKVLKALLKCCSKDREVLSSVFVDDRKVYATDQYVAVRISSAETAELENGSYPISTDVIRLAKLSENVPLAENMLAVDKFMVPNVDRVMDDGGKDMTVEMDYYIDPKLLRKVIDVFSAADCDVYFIFLENRLKVTGCKDGITIDAVVMGKRW